MEKFEMTKSMIEEIENNYKGLQEWREEEIAKPLTDENLLTITTINAEIKAYKKIFEALGLEIEDGHLTDEW